MNDDHVHSLDARRLLDEPDELYERAKAEALRLRHEAIADFVAGADARVRDAARRAARAANRFAARLRQHAKQRAFEA